MYTRPKREETEEDILKLQEEFLRGKQSTSAAVVNKRKSEHDNETISGDEQDSSKKKPRSKFASNRSSHSDIDGKTRDVVGPDILGEIKEKNMMQVFAPPPKATTTRQGFPEPFVRDKTIVTKGRSIFAQQVSKSKETDTKEMQVDLLHTNQQPQFADGNHPFGDGSFVLTGPDSQKIHHENVEKLCKMSNEEILTEQQKLISQLDPELLQFLRSRRQTKDQSAKLSSQDSVTDCDVSSSLKMDTDSVSDTNIPSGSKLEAKVQEVVDSMEAQSDGVSDINTEETASKLIDLGVKASEANRWLHMDVMEREKLHWIGDIPSAPTMPSDAPYSARFDFQGVLLPYADDNVDVTQALHHHGEEPERPGYTLQELLKLSRSSVLQQRVLAVTTLGNILDKTKAGYYDECMDTPLLHQLMDSDLYLLFRFSLDDNTETMVTATLLAMRNLFWNHADELCLDRLFGLWHGHYQPSLMVKSEAKKPSEKAEEKEEEAELKDHQILRLDMVKGSLRTDLMLRLRYILEVLKPGPKAVINVLEILTRIVRHSQDSAFAVTCCPRLLSTIITNFVPKDWGGIVGTSKPSEMTSVYGVPLVEALKLLRVIASCSRSMASDLVHKYEVMSSIVSYVSIDPRECGLPQQEAVRLSLESFYLWNTLMAYNLATSQFTDMYPVMMRLLQFHLSATSVADSASTFGHEHGAAVMSLLSEAMLLADAQMKRAASQKVANLTQRISVTLSYEHLSGFTQVLHLCLKKWLTQLARAEEITFTALKLVSATLNCAAMYYAKFHNQLGVDTVTKLEEIEDLMKSTVLPFLLSSNFKMLCSKIKASSCLLSSKQSGKDRDPQSLPSLGALLWGGREVVVSLSPTSPLPLFQGLAHFLSCLCTVHRGIHSQCIQNFLDNPQILDYVGQLGSRKLQAGDCWFTRVETFMLVDMLKLLSIVLPSKDFQHIGVYHNLALRLVSVISTEEKFLTKEIFSQVVFNPDFFRDCSNLTYSLDALNLSDVAPQQEQASIHQLLEKAQDRIPNLWHNYQTSLKLVAVTEHSPLDMLSQTAGENGLETAFPNDWAYLPVLKLYSQALSGKADSIDHTSYVVSTLQWLLLVECLRPRSMATISVTAKFCRLSTVFMAGNDLFLEPDVHHHLDALLRILLRSNSLLDFNEKIPGITSYYDLYTQLVEQFAAVSYGDELFGHFVLVPLQQRLSPSFRKLVWSEHAAVLRVLRTRPQQLAVPMKAYLEPCETDPSLLMCYLRGLAMGQVQETWCPVLYRVALHHVATFILEQRETSIGQQLTSRIQQLSNKKLQDLLLHYRVSEM